MNLLEALSKYEKVKLPAWAGFWEWDDDKQTIIMHTKEGKTLDIRETDRVKYTLENICADEFIEANSTNCDLLGGETRFDFGTAIKCVKKGMRVCREGWNGKRQYIQLATNISYDSEFGIINCEHRDIGNKAVAFVGTAGVEIGWLASQADMLAEDWMFAGKEK